MISIMELIDTTEKAIRIQVQESLHNIILEMNRLASAGITNISVRPLNEHEYEYLRYEGFTISKDCDGKTLIMWKGANDISIMAGFLCKKARDYIIQKNEENLEDIIQQMKKDANNGQYFSSVRSLIDEEIAFLQKRGFHVEHKPLSTTMIISWSENHKGEK